MGFRCLLRAERRRKSPRPTTAGSHVSILSQSYLHTIAIHAQRPSSEEAVVHRIALVSDVGGLRNLWDRVIDVLVVGRLISYLDTIAIVADVRWGKSENPAAPRATGFPIDPLRDQQPDALPPPCAAGRRHEQELRQSSNSFVLASSHSSNASTTPLPQVGFGAQQRAKWLCSLQP